MQIKAISGWATAAMLGVAGFALAYLLIAFVPLADVWAARRPGADAAAFAGTARIGGWIVVVLSLLAAAVAVAGWARRARSNLAAFGVRARHRMPLFDVAVGSVGRSATVRRRMKIHTWMLYGSLTAACGAAALGALEGLGNAGEIDDVRARVAGGEVVDGALVSELFGRQLLLRLPAAALFVLAAGLALLLIARVTSAQYGRVARLRGTLQALPSALSALRAGEDDWTVVLPAQATTPAGGTIRR